MKNLNKILNIKARHLPDFNQHQGRKSKHFCCARFRNILVYIKATFRIDLHKFVTSISRPPVF